MKRPNRRAGDDLDSNMQRAKETLALVGILAECLSNLAFREVDMSSIQRLEVDGWEAIVRMCDESRESLDAVYHLAATGRRRDGGDHAS